MPVPDNPKIYHIVHVDRLTSIIQNACLWSDAEMAQRRATGTTIGMNNIKAARLTQRTLNSHPCLHVGECVPFYFCPRSVMLRNPPGKPPRVGLPWWSRAHSAPGS